MVQKKKKNGNDFNLWHSILMIAIYYQTKTPISFWWKWELNRKSLIQQSETLSVELTEICRLLNDLHVMMS